MKTIREYLEEHGLKVTPQRVVVFNALIALKGHPTADEVFASIRKDHPNIALATVYNVLETLENIGLVNRVKTNSDIMRFEITSHRHHHLYCAVSDRIEDYHDDELNNIIAGYFEKKKIENFRIEDFRLQIIGNFTDLNK